MEHAREHAHVTGGHGWIRGGFDLVVAVLLGLTVISIAWGAYQAELQAKDADHYFNRSDETLSTAHKVELQGDQEVSTYEQLFLDLEQARAEGRTKAVAYLRTRLITPDLMRAITWWEQQPEETRPPFPFVDANPDYVNTYYDRGTTLEEDAAHALEKAHKAEQHEIDYTIVSVVLTVALFLLGMATQIIVPRIRIGLVALGALIFLGSLARFVDLTV